MSWATVAVAVVALAAAAAMVVWREQVRAAARSSGAFVGEVNAEVRKVTWPDRQQLKSMTWLILVFVAIVALLIGALDVVLQWILVTLPGRG